MAPSGLLKRIMIRAFENVNTFSISESGALFLGRITVDPAIPKVTLPTTKALAELLRPA